ncbi:SRPN8 [Trypoxylus dichotomus]
MKIVHLACAILVISATRADVQDDSVANAINEFGLKFLAETSSKLPEGTNLAISPYTVWTAMSIVNEGSRGNTAAQLERTLSIPAGNSTDRQAFRKLQQNIIRNIAQKTEGVTLDVLNSMFTRLEAKLNQDYVQLVRDVYDVQVEPLDFNKAAAAAARINHVISEATRGRISNVVDEESVLDAYMFITSALFFKGLWDKKFDKDLTKPEPFYDEHKRKIGDVDMMHNSGAFPFGPILNGKGLAIELPYLGGKLSMMIVLPARDESLSSLLRSISETPIARVMDYLKRSKEKFHDSKTYVKLPKFKISSSLLLADSLRNMGIVDAFDSRSANLSGISTVELYVSKVLHKTEIDVDEDGTTGSSVTVVDITEKSKAPTFAADRPFAFFVVDKESRLVIFLGTVYNPNAST